MAKRFAVALLLAAGCGGTDSGKVFAVEIAVGNGAGALLIGAPGGTLQLVATPRDKAGAAVGAAVSWSSSNTGVATVDGNGLVTGVALGTADITARAGGASGKTTIAVGRVPASVNVTPLSVSLERGASAELLAAVSDLQGNTMFDAPISWTSQNAAVATVSQSGLVTGIAVGTTSITAASGAKSGTATITVVVPAAASVTVASAQSGSLTSVNDTRQLTAAAVDMRGGPVPEAVFIWSSDDAATVSVDANGLATAKKNGTTTIRARSGTAAGAISLTVAQAVSSIAVSPATQSIPPGSTFTFTASALDARSNPLAPQPSVVWTIDDANIATINAATGQVLANAAITTIATTLVHATSGSVTGSAAISVDPNASNVASVSLTAPPGPLVSLGDTVQLTATARDSGGNPVSGVTFSWSSNQPGIATVNSASGLVTAVANGTATILVSGGGKSAQTSVTVSQAAATVAIATPASANFASIGDTVQLSASALDAKGNPVSGATFAWRTDPATSAAVTVSSTGVVTAVANGTATVFAKSGSTESSGTGFTVAQIITRVDVSPSSTSCASGTSVAFGAAGKDARSNATPGAATWKSSNPSAANIDSTGLVLCSNGGTSAISVTITATISGIDGTASLTVNGMSGH